MQGWFVSVLVLLSLYGVAQLMSKAAVRLCRPKSPCATVTLRLRGCMDDVEQQVRFAYAVAKEQRLPLSVMDDGADRETLCIARRVLRRGGLHVEKSQNLSVDACVAEQNDV